MAAKPLGRSSGPGKYLARTTPRPKTCWRVPYERAPRRGPRRREHRRALTAAVLAELRATAAVTPAGPVGFVGPCAPALVRPLARRFRSFARTRVGIPVAGPLGAGMMLGPDMLPRVSYRRTRRPPCRPPVDSRTAPAGRCPPPARYPPPGRRPLHVRAPARDRRARRAGLPVPPEDIVAAVRTVPDHWPSVTDRHWLGGTDDEPAPPGPYSAAGAGDASSTNSAPKGSWTGRGVRSSRSVPGRCPGGKREVLTGPNPTGRGKSRDRGFHD